MNLLEAAFAREKICRLAAIFLILGTFAPSLRFSAQTPGAGMPAAARVAERFSPEGDPADATADFRIEKVRVDGGAELLTILARPANTAGGDSGRDREIPLVSILRDTLGDNVPENDRLRYVWMLAYAKPSPGQKLAAFVPFLYSRTTNNKKVGNGPPPPIADMSPPGEGPWNTIFWFLFKTISFGDAGIGPKASILQYRQNAADYRRSAIARALSVLSLYESVHGERLLSESELKDIQARLWLTDKGFGGHMQSENLPRVYDKELAKTRDIRSQNWELLRQYSERQGLYFDPLEMPDGTTRHAIVWADAADIERNKDKKFDSRFLNIKNPWNDPKLSNWNGYSEVRWFDDTNREVGPDTPNAKSRTMIPLALYGLDFPKIPAILVDFRDNGNVKRREASRRVLHDITSNVLSLSQFTNVPYFFGRYLYDYVTGKTGIDVNQASRLRSYSQLKLLLSLDSSLDDHLRDEIANRLEHATLNPLENDLDVEAKLAWTQYDNLLAYAKRPDGLPAQLDRERREEMVKLKHGSTTRTLYSAAHFFSFGLFTKREKATPELVAQMDLRRQLDYHERFLREVAFSSEKPEVDTDMTDLKSSLMFVSQNGAAAKEKTTRALARIFAITDDEDMRGLCLTGLYRINNASAKKELLAIYGGSKAGERWHDMSAHYLKLALKEGQQISARDAQAIDGIGTN